MINTITIAVLAGLFLARAPVALRHPYARPAWIASGVGILALLSIGVIIPIPVADSWLGGSNSLFLLRTILPVIAFWFLREAVALQVGARRPRGRRVLLCALLGAQIIFFILIPERGVTDVSFVDNQMIFPAAFVWAFVYAGAIIWISFEIVGQLAPHRGWFFLPFKLGGIMTIIGGVALIIHCGLILGRVVGPASGDFAWILFNVFFYPGILLIVAGFLGITFRDAWRLAPWRIRVVRLRRMLATYQPTTFVARVGAFVRAAAADPVQQTYEAAIAIRNLQYLHGRDLRDSDTKQLVEAENRLEEMSVMPAIVSSR